MEFIKNYEPPLSLWKMITDVIAVNETFEVKSYLGEDLVDQSIELREEIETLLSIYKEVDSERAAGDSIFSLPEPPEVRERLIKEISFFVKNIRDQAKSEGRNPDTLLQHCSTDIIEYATDSAFSSRPTTSDYSQISTSRSSASSRAEHININSMKEKLNYLSFEEIQANLKQFLQEEVDQLNNDITEVNAALCSQEPLTSRSSTSFSQPTISQLKTERRELEQILMNSSRPSSSSNKQPQSKMPLKPQHSRQRLSLNNKNPSFKLLPDTPNRLQPLQKTPNHNKDRPLGALVEHFKSPLDLALTESVNDANINIPEQQVDIDIIDPSLSHNTNTYHKQSHEDDELSRELSQISISTSSSRSNSQLSNHTNDNTRSKDRTFRYNSAQKFRQRILQNRKESLEYQT